MSGGLTMMDLKSRIEYENAEAAMRAMLIQLLDPLLDSPEQSSVALLRCGETTNFIVELNVEDLERLAGGTARTARSLKQLVSAVGLKSNRKFTLTLQKKNGVAVDSRALLPEILKT